MRLIVFVLYLGTGALLHAIFVGPQFDWTSAWTLGWLLGWPIVVIGAIWTFVIVIIAIVFFWFCLVGLVDGLRSVLMRKHGERRRAL